MCDRACDARDPDETDSGVQAFASHPKIGCQLAANTSQIGAKWGEEMVDFPAESHDLSTS
jgi:hypothetical protein